jgi:rhamnosyltransferase
MTKHRAKTTRTVNASWANSGFELINEVTISIIMPTLNAALYTAKLMNAFESQTLSIHELLVIDSASTDNTKSTFEAAGAMVHTIDPKEFQHGKARNLGASLTQGEILVFMTQDAIPANETWLENLIKPLITGEAAASFARQVAYESANPLEQFARETNYPATSRVVSEADIKTLGARAFFFSNSCSAIRRDVFEELGGFSSGTIMNEDMLFASRLLRQGYKIAYTADAQVFHSHDYTVEKTFKRYFDIGVVMKQAEIDLAAAPLSKEGSSYVKKLLTTLIRSKQYSFIPMAVGESAAKWFGFQLGKSYRFLPQGLLKVLSMHSRYWNSSRFTFSILELLVTPITLMAVDCFAVLLSLLTAIFLRTTLLQKFFDLEPFVPAVNYSILWPALVILLMLRASFGLYPGYAMNPADELRRQTLSSAVTLFFLLAGSALFNFTSYFSRPVLVITGFFLLFLLPLFRAGAKALLAKSPYYGRPVWILGNSERAEKLKDILERNPVMGLKVVGYSSHLPEDVFVQQCLVIPENLEVESFGGFVDKLHRQFRRVWLAPTLLDTGSVWITPHDLKGHLTLELRNMLTEPRNELLKRAFDFIFSSLLLLALSPLLLLIALLVRSSSAGPVMFSQERVGRYGRIIATTCLATLKQTRSGKKRGSSRTTHASRYLVNY